MLKAISCFILLFIVISGYAQPPGTDDSIMNIKGKWTTGEKVNQTQDAGLKATQIPFIHKKLDSIALLFKKTYSLPTGAEAKWYANVGQYRLFENAPAAYSFWSLYKYYYYNKNYKKIILGDETGTWAYVFVNYFNWLLEYIKLDVFIEGGQKKIWKLPKQFSEQWKGHPVFETPAHSPNAKAVVITKNGIMPWKPVSQLQYLKVLRTKKEDELKQMIKTYDDNIVKSRKMIEEIRNKKDFPQDSKTKMIAIAEQQLGKQIQDRDKTIQNNTAFFNKELEIIDTYLASQSSGTLDQPAILNTYKDFIFQKKFEDPTHKDAITLVYINEGYFNNKIPQHEPQFMVLYWRWNDNAPGLFFKKQFEENFPVEKLNAMLVK